jgi:hypothetical protein
MVESTALARNKNSPCDFLDKFLAKPFQVGRNHWVPLHAALLPHICLMNVGVRLILWYDRGGCWKRLRAFSMYAGIERCTFCLDNPT